MTSHHYDEARRRLFPSAGEDAAAALLDLGRPQTDAPTYRLAYADGDFLMRDELRPVRLQLELLKPELVLNEAGITSTIVVFGSARIPEPEVARQVLDAAISAEAAAPDDETLRDARIRAERVAAKSRYYDEARRFATLVSRSDARHGRRVIVTGGGPGIMEAANRGAAEADAPSIGLNIALQYEQFPNHYISPEFCFQFHYFAIRKMHFLMRAEALVAFPGGFGTLDELFETLTLVQTRKIRRMPILLFGREYWQRVIDFDALADEGVIAPEDTRLFTYVETAEEALRAIDSFVRD
jgi:uncharacterized protein (TIGR00730 family)